PSHGNVVSRAAADDDIDDFLENRTEIPVRDVSLPEETPRLLARCRWVHAVALSSVAELDETVMLRVTALNSTSAQYATHLAQRLAETWTDELALETFVRPDSTTPYSCTIELRGVLASHYASAECGFHAVANADSSCPGLICVQRM